MPSKQWKNTERRIAREWFDSERNPLSGRNARNDQGGRRAGDVIYDPALVEIKHYRKIATISRALETFKQAKEEGRVRWVHIEKINSKNPLINRIYCVAVDGKDALRMIRFLRCWWEPSNVKLLQETIAKMLSRSDWRTVIKEVAVKMSESES